ncbi:lymphocyte expansion molecule [Sceloporus undulatus]|uniref:lymphocyte expansion molecule n=1 Tax=Sceloporus undulatus TaxID=8520 RepID=UPI001C4C48CC|nr:lymphocyte expansion molecule [Sceloporus undulatus]
MEPKGFTGAPFGSQTARFDVSAIYPNVKRPSTFLQAPYSKTVCSDLNRKLGPGTYSTDYGGFSSATSFQKQFSSSSWAKAQEAARLTQMPHFHFKEICFREKLLKEKLGPGTYNYKDFLELQEKRPHSIRGICNTGEGSGLGPGTYNLKNGIDEMLKRVVSKKGPYETFTGDRSKPIKCGHYATDKKPTELSKSKVKSFLEELETKEKRKHGVFSTLAQYPKYPTERIFWATVGLGPHEQFRAGPGSYNIMPIKRKEFENQPPFWVGAKRFDKKALRLFFGSANPVGVGRYDATKHEKYPKKIRYRSLYMNEARRYLSNLERDKYLQARITPVNKGHWENSAS